MITFILQGISLAFSAAMLPGPFQAYLINNTLALGWRRTLILTLTPLITDAPLIVMVLFVLRSVPPEFIRLLQVGGGLLLLWIAYGAWKTWRANALPQAPDQIETSAVQVTPFGMLRRGVMMGLLSPGPWLFWSTVNGPLLIRGLSESIWHGIAFLVSFYGVFLLLIGATILIFDRLRRIDARFTRLLLLLTIGILVVFGLSLIVQGIRG